MKWSFKKNLEPITALQMRMIIDNPTFDDLCQALGQSADMTYRPKLALFARLREEQFPPGFRSVLKKRPWGFALGNIAHLMRDVTLNEVLRNQLLWDEVWSKRVDKPANKLEMTRKLYEELRASIVCPICQAHPSQRVQCQICHGSGAQQHVVCIYCAGEGVAKMHMPSFFNKASKTRTPPPPCQECHGLGLIEQDVPSRFLDRLQYLWTARNIRAIEGTFRWWLSNLAMLVIFVIAAAIFGLGVLISGRAVTGDLLIEGLLFSSAILVGTIGTAVIITFGVVFNSSATFLDTYPIRFSQFGNELWVKLMNLITILSAGTLFLNSTFVMSQVLLQHPLNVPLIIGAAIALLFFVSLFTAGGIFRIHLAMRDAKHSRLDEIGHWLDQQHKQQDGAFETTEEEAFFKELRELREWPLETSLVVSIISGVLVPIGVSLLSILLPGGSHL